jgi:hypothetical protein
VLAVPVFAVNRQRRVAVDVHVETRQPVADPAETVAEDQQLGIAQLLAPVPDGGGLMLQVRNA